MYIDFQIVTDADELLKAYKSLGCIIGEVDKYIENNNVKNKAELDEHLKHLSNLSITLEHMLMSRGVGAYDD